jgi:threonine dehydratase
LGIRAIIVVPKDAPSAKLDLIRGFGAELAYSEPNLESRESVCEELSQKYGLAVVPPFNHEWTMAGQGTILADVLEELPELDAILVAVGGCGMISGISTLAKSAARHIHVYGVEPEAVDDTVLSLSCGYRRHPTDTTASTICDALRVSPPGELCFPIVQKYVDEVFTVSDAQVIQAMKLHWDHLGQKTEPSGACATAGLLSEKFLAILKCNPSIQRVCIVICGGNIEDKIFHDLV